MLRSIFFLKTIVYQTMWLAAKGELLLEGEGVLVIFLFLFTDFKCVILCYFTHYNKFLKGSEMKM